METTPSIDRKKLAEENHNLIYWFCQKNHLYLEEWYDIIAIAYMKGINNYNENSGVKLSTYLTKIMRNEYLLTLRNRNSGKHIPESEILSLDYKYNYGDNEDKCSIMDLVTNENSFFENEICFKNDIKRVMSELKISKRNFGIFFMRSQGYTLEEVASEFNITRERVRMICKQIGEKLRTKLKTDGVDYFEY